METYELNLYGPRDSAAPVRVSLGKHAFEATDNLTAIHYVKTELSGALAAADYAVLHHVRDGTIWEDFGRAAYADRPGAKGKTANAN
jgi:hypothetical protein